MKQAPKETQSITVVLKDVGNRTLLFYEEHRSADGPVQGALDAAYRFFDRHFQTFAKASPKDFIIYFKSDSCPPSFMTAQLIVDEFTVSRSVMGSDEEPAAEAFPYFLDHSVPADVEPPDEFPNDIDRFLGIRSPGVSPSTEFVRKLDERPELTSRIEDAIITRIKKLPDDLGKGRGDTDWTVELMRVIGTLGHEQGWAVCASKCRELFDGGWLYDLTWYRNGPNDHLNELGLVLESEWRRNLGFIKFDFEKLLAAKAPIKVLVFQDWNGNLPQLWSFLETGIACFKPQGLHETYILAAYQEDKHEFTVRTIKAA